MRKLSFLISVLFFFALHHCVAEELLLGESQEENKSETCPVNGSEHKHGEPCKVLTPAIQKSSLVRILDQMLELKNINLTSDLEVFLCSLLNPITVDLTNPSNLVVYTNKSKKNHKLLLSTLKLAPNAPPVNI